jgi:glycosyltransferase involved in cell wall biosynthesis
MSEVVVRLGHHKVAIELPEHLLSDGILASLKSDVPAAGVDERIIVSVAGDRSYALQGHGGSREGGLKRGALLNRLLASVADRATKMAGTPVLRAAAVSWGDGAVLIAGPARSGKSSLAAWFVEKGFALIGDDRVALVDATGSLAGYLAPFTFAADAADHLVALSEFSMAPMAQTGERIHVGVKESWRQTGESCPCRVMIFPRHDPDTEPRLDKLDAFDAARLIKEQLVSPKAAGGGNDYWHIEMARTIPAIAVTYSRYKELDGLLDRLVKLVIDENLSREALDHFISNISQTETGPGHKYPIPERSTREFSPFMTIGMATYDDYDGVYFSLQAIRLYHPEILDEVEFLIIDNHPDGPCAAALKDLERHVPNLRYVPVADVTATAVKYRIFGEAGGEFILGMDCHVFFVPGSLRKLIDYFKANPSSIDLVQGPMIYDDLKKISTHWSENWRMGMFGQWANDPAGEDPDGPPFDIPFQGLGVFACSRNAWPGFNPGFRGFGGEEGYFHEKFRQAGGRTLCLPSLRWLHRFGRPMGVPYPNKWEDRIRNYLIGFDEVGWDTKEMQAHFGELLGRRKADNIFAAVRKALAAEAANVVPPAMPASFEDDEPYDLNEARLRFVAEAAVPVLLDKFEFAAVSCCGRGAGLWAGEFARHGIASTENRQEDGPDRSYDLVCNFETDGITSLALAEQHVARLTSTASVVVFTFARPPAEGAIDHNRLRASWVALFARRGYKPVDCLRPALKHDPRADDHYRQNLIVFSRKAPVSGARPLPAVATETPGPGVSVILPVYNGAAYLAQAIESILLQTHQNFELIVVNDGSGDATGAIADSYARVDTRVRVIHQENRGEQAAFNAGCANARFDLLARLDHDDVALPDRLALQAAFLEKNPDIAVVGGQMRVIDRDGRLTKARMAYPLTPDECHKVLLNATAPPISNPASMIRKAAVEACGGQRGQFDLAGDFDFWLRIDEQFKLANLPDVVVDYRMHGANRSLQKRFTQVLAARIARLAANLRRRGEPDPVDGWARLELAQLSVFLMSEKEQAETYRELFAAALDNFAAVPDPEYLRLADKCLALSPTGPIA